MINQHLNENTNSMNWRKIILVIVGIVLVLSVIAAIIFAVRRNSLDYEITGGSFEMRYQEIDGFSEILNIYYNLPSELPVEYFDKILDSGKVNRDYVQINENGESYIAAFPVSAEADFNQQNAEFISFNYIPGDGETEVPLVSDITYHNFRDGRHDFIQETASGVYTHTGDDLSNSYDDKASAIDSFLMTAT